MSEEDVGIVRRFRAAVRDDDRESAAAVLAPDVEWVISKNKTLHGVDEVANHYLGKPSGGPANLDVEFDPGELEDGGDGRVSAVNHQIFRWKESGELAYERWARIDYTIRDGRIVRYEATLLDE